MSDIASHPDNNDRSRGRPREFDMDAVLDKAVQVFSERGYHGTSITDLTRAMKLAQGSIYKAFGDKQGVFVAAFRHYRAVRTEKLRKAIGPDGTGLQRLRRALEFYVASTQGDEGRRGCLVAGSAAGLSTFEPEVAGHITEALVRNETVLRDLIREGQQDGSIPAHIDGEAAARMMLCFVQGMRLVGKTGRSREDMLAAVTAALQALT